MPLSKLARIANRLWLKFAQKLVVTQRASKRACSAKILNIHNINPDVANLNLASKSPVTARAERIEKELRGGARKPFKRLIKANIGDVQALGQKPLTFIRQVLASVSDPNLSNEVNSYPPDVRSRAETLVRNFTGGTLGSYSRSTGVRSIRRNVAEFLWERDRCDADHNNIFLCAGASAGIRNVLELFVNDIDGKPTGVMVPVPLCPLYTAALLELRLAPVGYLLDEQREWAVSVHELQRALDAAQQQFAVRAIVVINPGNPTGQVLSEKNIKEVIQFAHANHLMVLADEVYQDNVFHGDFHSFKKVLQSMGQKIGRELELASFMSASKGFSAESGVRGGWMELVNVDRRVRDTLRHKLAALQCPNTPGQVVVDCVARPPRRWQPSFDLWRKETSDILDGLKEQSKLLIKTFNSMRGVECSFIKGSRYAFPNIILSQNAIAAAQKTNLAPDEFYAAKLLEETGVCLSAGSEFGQKAGTYHLRATVLPRADTVDEMCHILQKFHVRFMDEFGCPDTLTSDKTNK